MKTDHWSGTRKFAHIYSFTIAPPTFNLFERKNASCRRWSCLPYQQIIANPMEKMSISHGKVMVCSVPPNMKYQKTSKNEGPILNPGSKRRVGFKPNLAGEVNPPNNVNSKVGIISSTYVQDRHIEAWLCQSQIVNTINLCIPIRIVGKFQDPPSDISEISKRSEE